MRSRPVALLAVAAAFVVVAACGSSSGGEAGPTTTIAVTTTAAPTTTAPTTAAPTTAPPTTGAPATTPPATTAPSTTETATTVDPNYIPTDPDAYADFLIKAWAAGDRPRALRFGTPSAVDTLFAYEAGGEEGAPPPDWQFVECEGAAGSSYCTFSAGGDPKIIVRVLNEAASMGQQQAVTEVQVEA